MKNSSITVLVIGFILSFQWAQSQHKYEREHRILKSQFPAEAMRTIEENVADYKRIKFYKETDSVQINYEAKLKKDKLWYYISFNEDGVLEHIKILITSNDIPNDSYVSIESYLNNTFEKYKIKRIEQQYHSNLSTLAETFKNAFQNLIIPTNDYEFLVVGKKNTENSDYEILFDADGNFKQSKLALPPNYDHVLY